jgi:hypothetical protein
VVEVEGIVGSVVEIALPGWRIIPFNLTMATIEQAVSKVTEQYQGVEARRRLLARQPRPGHLATAVTV